MAESAEQQLERAEQIIRGLLLSADVSWRLTNGGHDWNEAVQEAEAFLTGKTFCAYCGKDMTWSCGLYRVANNRWYCCDTCVSAGGNHEQS